MRTYGRIYDSNSNSTGWQVVETDQNGFNDYVWLTTLIQCLLLNLGESPFYAQYGIPAQPTVIQQVQPDFYVARTQQQFAQYFANLVVAKQGNNPPTYRISVTTHQGAKIAVTIYMPSSGK